MARIVIKTKSIYAPVDKNDGFRVLITRFYPRGTKREKYDVWLRDLAPSRELLKRHKNNEIVWEDFLTELLSEMQNNNSSVDAIRSLNTKGNTQDITLLCYEKDGLPCHRHLIKDLVAKPSMLGSDFILKKTDEYNTASVMIRATD
ncbi:MAG: DUF488 family protein [Nitrosopumilus sp. H13]|nr:MAG: DUF488 family protein [Nitrosopumilus sp. H13]